MQSSGSSTAWPIAGFLAKWCIRVLVCGVSLGLMALAGGAASSKSARSSSPAIAAMAHAYSGVGNLVPVW